MGLGCAGKCGMIFLIVLNVLFMLLGLALLILGILMQVNVDVISDEIMPLLQQLTFNGLNLGDLANGLSITFIVFGAFVLTISAFGAFGACCQKRICLVVYAIVVAIFFIGKLVAVILWFVMNDKLQSFLKSELQSQLDNNYKNADLTSHEISTAWNYLFMQLSCCGVEAVTSSTTGFENSYWKANNAASDNIPIFCCSGVTADNYASTTNTACTQSVTSSYNTKGCYDAVYDKLSSYTTGFIVVGVIVLLVEVRVIINKNDNSCVK
ncbi:hypothetical protein FSP39_002060 [Pinctada imbricata]|uniref:Tetraspanin n=1 Tax=Pinctada imbricata TaxID=66713 RepID=A0AA88YK76_PINIB|nr:hypothetical protein FSP39_002060 [Pinctada imbricata]